MEFAVCSCEGGDNETQPTEGKLQTTNSKLQTAKVDFVEPLGSETLVHLVMLDGKATAIARVQGFAPFRHCENVAVEFDQSKIVLF